MTWCETDAPVFHFLFLVKRIKKNKVTFTCRYSCCHVVGAVSSQAAHLTLFHIYRAGLGCNSHKELMRASVVCCLFTGV